MIENRALLWYNNKWAFMPIRSFLYWQKVHVSEFAQLIVPYRDGLYTIDQVHQIIEEILHKLDRTLAFPQKAEHLDNQIPLNASPKDAKITLTVHEAAVLIGISKPKMYELVRAGKVRSVKVGKKILISRQSLMDWLMKGDSYGKEAC